jgi:uncharacterized protein (TIRG00374 family)
LFSVTINNLAKAARWRILIGGKGKDLRFPALLMAHLSGQMINITFSPVRVGELSRAYIVGGMGPGRVYAFGTILIEKVLDMVCYALLFVLLLLMIPLPAWMSGSGYTFITLTILILVAVLVITVQRKWVIKAVDRLLGLLPERIQFSTTNRIRSGLESLDVLQSRMDLLKLAFWSALIWSTALLNVYLVLQAVRIDVPLTASLLTLIALQVGITVPSIPGNIGVLEYIAILSLSVFGIDQSQALGFGILLHVIVFLPVIFTGLISLWMLNAGGGRFGDLVVSKEMVSSQVSSPLSSQQGEG